MKNLATARKHWRGISIVGVALAFLAVSAWAFFDSYRMTHNPTPVISAAVVTHSSDAPDETPLGDVCDRYQVPGNEPRKIAIPKLGISECVQKVGIDQRNAIAVPTNVHLAGWYSESVRPGEVGVSIMDGHVRGRYRDGIFVRLHELVEGDEIRIEMGDGSLRTFVAAKTSSYSVEAAGAELFKSLYSTQLNLITCGGAYNEAAQEYPERVIVQARLQ